MDIKKAKGSSDTVQSDHIERKIIPKNADPTRTHLNRVLVEYPDGVHGRDEAIAHRPVSYTHLDVYKRQIRPLLLPGPVWLPTVAS